MGPTGSQALALELQGPAVRYTKDSPRTHVTASLSRCGWHRGGIPKLPECYCLGITAANCYGSSNMNTPTTKIWKQQLALPLHGISGLLHDKLAVRGTHVRQNAERNGYR